MKIANASSQEEVCSMGVGRWGGFLEGPVWGVCVWQVMLELSSRITVETGAHHSFLFFK